MAATEVVHVRALERRGAYDDAAALGKRLRAGKADGALVLETARALMRAGRPRAALEHIQRSEQRNASPTHRLLLDLEAAWLLILIDLEIDRALTGAREALQTKPLGTLAPSDAAEAEWVYSRLLLTAGAFHEIPPEELRTAVQRTAELADQLAMAGRHDAALAARFAWAERCGDAQAQRAALADLAKEAVGYGRTDLAAEAWLCQAEIALNASLDEDVVRTGLDQAAALYRSLRHVHGGIDVDRARARLDIERKGDNLGRLQECLEAYRRIDFPRGMLSTLLDLSQLAHERGDTASAGRYRDELLSLADEVGMGMTRAGSLLAQADLLLRAGEFSAARDLCGAALARNLPRAYAASFEQIRATALSMVGDLEAAIPGARRALDLFEATGALGEASNAALKLASDLCEPRRDPGLAEADQLLAKWVARDEQRDDYAAAAAKREQQIQLRLLRFNWGDVGRGEERLLDEGDALASETECAVRTHLIGRAQAQRLGNLAQLRAQIAHCRQDEAGNERALREALGHFESNGFEMEAANCRYILGCLFLNRANVELMPHFGEAERFLAAALDFYDSVGMRRQAANARFMLAQLYANAAPRVADPLGPQMRTAALGHLDQGERDLDALRQAYWSPSVLHARIGKRALTVDAERLCHLALQLLCGAAFDPARAWAWAQRAKSRALNDLLGAGTRMPARLERRLAAAPELLSLAREEEQLSRKLAEAGAAEIPELRQRLAEVRARMTTAPELAEYLELRTGAALEASDLDALLKGITAPVVCVDWFAIGDRLYLTAARSGGLPDIRALDVGLDAARAFAADHLAPESFRATLRDSPHLLREMDGLVAPLAHLTAPEEHIVLCPTGALHALPLHALEVEGRPLIARNPIGYTPSLGVLRQCATRAHAAHRGEAVVIFGDPEEDRKEALALVEALGRRLSSRPVLGNAVTRARFQTALNEASLIHFQGHAVHERGQALRSHLRFAADEQLDAESLFEMADVSAGTIVLGACESAANQVDVGDELLGLIPAFLVAGARRVVAALWRVRQDAASAFMQAFYDHLLATPRASPIEATRAAILEVRGRPEFAAPLYWAPFILHGDGWERIAP